MKLRILIWLSVCCFFSSSDVLAQSRHIRIELFPAHKDEIPDYVNSNLDITHVHEDHMDILVSPAELEKLKGSGATIEILDEDVYDGPEGGGWLSEYQSFSEVQAQLNQFTVDYPDLTELIVIGSSLEGRDICALKISDNASSDEAEAEILLVGTTHAREIITPMVCMHVAEELLTGYGSDPTYTDWVDNREIWIVPILNPDGFVYVETTDLFWRKNRRDNPGDDEGVDLNRNWGFEWGHDNRGSSGNYGSSTYRGTGPFSEPETDILAQWVLTRDFNVCMSFHSFSNLLLWGPGFKPANSPDEDIFGGFGEVVTAQNNYTIGNAASGTIYLVNGECTDWMYNVAGVLAFTPEVGNSSDYFNPPASRIPTLIQEGSVCAWAAIEFGDRPGQLAPPGPPSMNSVATNTGDYDVTWNAPTTADTEVVAYELVEKTGPQVVTDGAENGDSNFELNGWILSDVRNNGGGFSFAAGFDNRTNFICLTKDPYIVQPGDALTFDAWWELENNYDYLYAVVSLDGGRSYESLPGTFTTMNDPRGRNADNGITGDSNGWQAMSFDLSNYVGQSVHLGFRCNTDGGALEEGVWIDNVSPVQSFATSTVIDSAIGTAQYSFSGKPDGVYFYGVRGLDAEGEWGYVSDLAPVVVGYSRPDSLLITRGQYLSGDAADLGTSDDNRLQIVRSLLDVQSRTEFEAESTSPLANPSGMSVMIEGSVFARGTVERTIELFDFDSSQWEVVDVRAATRFSDSAATINITGDVSRFIQPGSNTISARVRYQSPSNRQVFASRTDQFVWIIEP
ncbi:MAG: M14 family zinc carboxypeptidase [Planctomycetota bacterium]